MEDLEGKSLLLIEVLEDPSDKKMPYKLKLNKDSVEELLSRGGDRYVG